MNYEPRTGSSDRSSSVLIRKQQLPAGERIGEYEPSLDDLGARRQSLDSSQCHQKSQDKERDPDHGQVVRFACAHHIIAALVYSPHL